MKNIFKWMMLLVTLMSFSGCSYAKMEDSFVQKAKDLIPKRTQEHAADIDKEAVGSGTEHTGEEEKSNIIADIGETLVSYCGGFRGESSGFYEYTVTESKIMTDLSETDVLRSEFKIDSETDAIVDENGNFTDDAYVFLYVKMNIKNRDIDMSGISQFADGMNADADQRATMIPNTIADEDCFLRTRDDGLTDGNYYHLAYCSEYALPLNAGDFFADIAYGWTHIDMGETIEGIKIIWIIPKTALQKNLYLCLDISGSPPYPLMPRTLVYKKEES